MNMTQNKNINNIFRSVSNETFSNGRHLKKFLREEGIYDWTTNNPQRYNGQFFNNTLHGRGTYIWNIDREKYVYEGKFYSNNIEGYGRFSYPDGKVFEGLFKANKRFGPGVQIYSDGTQDIGIWKGLSLIRLTRNSSRRIPVLGETARGQLYLSQYKTLIPVDVMSKSRLEQDLDKLEISKDYKDIINLLYYTSETSPSGLLFNKKQFDANYFENDPPYCVEVSENIDNNIVSRTIQVSDLLAWNNDPLYLEIMQHAFRNRNLEDNISFSVPEILNGQSKMFRDTGRYEKVCLDFLEACSKEDEVDKYFNEHKLDPNVCDAFGNSGLMYAVVSDNFHLIRNLFDCRVNLNHMNDEGLTPLLVCLLRYVALKNDVQSWEKAFLPPIVLEREENIQDWRKRNLELVESMDTTSQVYLFDLSCAHPAKPQGKAKKDKEKDGKKGKKEIEVIKPPPVVIDPKEVALQEILKTIVRLLCYGADGNFGKVPLPPIFLALFTQRPAVLGQLVKFGADCNAVMDTPDKLSPLHVVCSIKPFGELIQMADILLNNGANTSWRAAPSHWEEEKVNLVADEVVDDLGKTPLHLLAMRWDYDYDVDDIFGSIFGLFCRYEADLSEKYLGHTPLSLAVLRGNTRLINTMMNSRRVNVNEELENGLGFPLVVLVLKRYACFLPFNLAKSVIDTLLSHHANPFSIVTNLDKTAFEFVHEDNRPEEGKKKEKVKKEHTKLLNHFKTCTEHVLLRHIQGRVIKFLYINKFKNHINHILYDTVVNFVDINETLNILQTLITYRAIRPDEHFCLQLIEYVCEATAPKKSKNAKQSKKKETSPSDLLEKLDLQKRKYIFFDAMPPETDAPEKYRVCFECYEKTNKELVPCPKCKLVYFCSTSCNNSNNKKKTTKHPCKLVFYSSELEHRRKLKDTGHEIDDGFQDILPIRKVQRNRFDFFFKEFDFGEDSSSEESESESGPKDGKSAKGKKSKHTEKDEDDGKGKKKKKGADSSTTVEGTSDEKQKGKKRESSLESGVSGEKHTIKKGKHDEADDDVKSKKSKKGKNIDHLKSKSGSSDNLDSKQMPGSKMKKGKEEAGEANEKSKRDASKEKKKKKGDVTFGDSSEDEVERKKMKKEKSVKEKHDKPVKLSKKGSTEKEVGSKKEKISAREKSTKEAKEKHLKEVKEKPEKQTKPKSLMETKQVKPTKVKLKIQTQDVKHSQREKSKSRKASRAGQDSPRTTKEISKQSDRSRLRSVSADRKTKTDHHSETEKHAFYSKSDSYLGDKESQKEKVCGDDLDLIGREFEDKFVLYCTLADGQLYYKVEDKSIRCKFNYSLV